MVDHDEQARGLVARSAERDPAVDALLEPVAGRRHAPGVPGIDREIGSRGHGSGWVLIAATGLLGSETAGSLRTLGASVSLVDPASRPLSSHLGAAAADWVRGEHLRADVDLRTGTGVAAVDAAGQAVVATLDDGSTVQVDVVVASLGVSPAVDWLRRSGLPVADGVPVDAGMRVLDHPGFYAADDLAAVHGPDGALVRTEHWGSALGQGRVASASVLADLGLAEPADEALPVVPPGYSTYVHGTKLTIIGWAHAAVDEAVVHGAVGDQRFTIALLDSGGRITAAVGVGGARVANRLRALIARRAHIGEVDRVLERAA